MTNGPLHDDALEANPFQYDIVDGDDIEALRAVKNSARSRWRMTHVQLDSAARREPRDADAQRTHEAHAEHLAALQQWTAAEAAFIAARLGFHTSD